MRVHASIAIGFRLTTRSFCTGSAALAPGVEVTTDQLYRMGRPAPHVSLGGCDDTVSTVVDRLEHAHRIGARDSQKWTSSASCVIAHSAKPVPCDTLKS